MVFYITNDSPGKDYPKDYDATEKSLKGKWVM